MSSERCVPFALCLISFVFLATLNSAGYRYGASDQAFYVPAILKRLHPSLYPRDSTLIQSQAKLTFADETVSALVRTSGASVPVLFAVLYLLALVLLASAAFLIGGVLYRTWWASVALAMALTMRHAIAKSGTNTLEGYFHPRVLAFALGACAVAAFLKRRLSAAVALVLVAAPLHPTTALWFAIWLVVAAVISERRLRVPVALTAAAAILLGAWSLWKGALAGRLSAMDPAWVATLAQKDYLFPLSWPPWVWLFNLGYVPLIIWLFRRRRASGLAAPREGPVVAGCLALVLVFAATLPLNAARVQIAIQMQPARIFWMLDFLATVYAIWALAEGLGEPARRARTVASVVLALSVIRAAYVKMVVFPTRPIAQLHVDDSDWGRAMAWARTTASDSGWLADPRHAVRYGSSVRVAAERDIFVEAVKDAAIGMYDRDVAMRTWERVETLGEFNALTVAHARELAATYSLDYLVTEQPLALPLAFSSGSIRVYRLR